MSLSLNRKDYPSVGLISEDLAPSHGRCMCMDWMDGWMDTDACMNVCVDRLQVYMDWMDGLMHV
jgi:hypothetical protein